MRKENLTQFEQDAIIGIGSTVCKKLKIIYPEKKWIEIPERFTAFKNALRPMFAASSEMEFHRALEKFTVEDIQETLCEARSDEKSARPCKDTGGLESGV